MPKPILPDEVWSLIQPLLPIRPPHPKGGRPAVGDRDVLTGIVFVLKSGVPWSDLPEELGCGSGMTCLRRLREWQRHNVWSQIEEILKTHLHQAERMQWSRAEPGIRQMARRAAEKLLETEQVAGAAEMRLEPQQSGAV